MRWNIGSSSTSNQTLIDPSSSLPSDHPSISSSSSSSSGPSNQPPAQCPMHQSTPTSVVKETSKSGMAKCPIDHDNLDPKMNPLNNIPANLSLHKQPDQKLDLPTDRTTSTIPRPKGENPGGEGYGTGSTWDYPSPQQFYNALVRKGWETPEDSVEVMVDIHNFLNERAWQEVMRWEKRLPGGENAQLARFTGRPGELSPKARMHLLFGKFFPSSFNTEPPFDRHDWIVTRPVETSTKIPKEETSTRYVIDYYSAPPDEDGNPVFSLDVRPALDTFESISERVKVGIEDWRKGTSDQ
ncbi:uncharacterized protein IL334_006104 [Kwoniella shivajii]|uniref:Holocytochrome c-type synthase n=1 Tax=Kwoniella shivajii TaxID=564305 RepID=A0ABZ1D5C5_9TREE|nr:hypothetical protein IL334_006104 [Kwoniella shivajii]